MTDEIGSIGLISIDPRVLAALRITADELKAMGLRELSNRAFDAGYEWSISCGKAKIGQGKLTVRMDAPGFLNTDAA